VNNAPRPSTSARVSCSKARIRPRIPVADDFDNQIRQDQQPILQQRRRRTSRVLITVCGLAVIAAACAYLWFNYDDLVRSVSFTSHSAAAPVIDSGEETVTLKDFQSFQLQTTDLLQSAAQDIATQKADLKSVLDQVSVLTAKIDGLQTAAPATGPLLPPAELRPGSQPAIPDRVPVIAARKKPPAPKTTGPISVGGAPLTPAPSADRQGR